MSTIPASEEFRPRWLTVRLGNPKVIAQFDALVERERERLLNGGDETSFAYTLDPADFARDLLCWAIGYMFTDQELDEFRDDDVITIDAEILAREFADISA